MIPGVVAQQAKVRVSVGVRPVFSAVASSAGISGALTVALPAGWSEAQLAIMHVASGSAAPSTPAGWNVLGSTLTSDSGTSALYWRILQSGDADPVLSAGTNRAAAVWTFEAGTFNAASPILQIASSSSASGVSSNPSVGASSSVAVGEHFVVQFASTYNVFNTVSAYPYASAQHQRGIGSTPAYVSNRGCGANFNGGVSAGSGFTISANAYWTSRKIAIVGNGFTA